MENIKATVFDIQRFSVHDGPGIRTTVFLKGCPLNCLWCHNPESKSKYPELMIYEKSCIGCGECLSACPDNLHKFDDKLHTVDRVSCIGCGKCASACVSGAITVCGKEMSVSEVLSEVVRDKSFYDNSGGGVTVSGGEPLMQADFVYDFLAKLNGIHRAIETSGYSSCEVFRKVVSVCDLVIMDIKLADSAEHLKHTGVSNEQILENLEYLKSSGIPHLFRTPLIPGITDTEENLSDIAKIVDGSAWERLPYNTLAPTKYKSVGRVYKL